MGRLLGMNLGTLKILLLTLVGMVINIKLIGYYDFKPILKAEKFRYGSYFGTDFANTEICKGKDEHFCAPGLMKHYSTIYIAPQYNLTTCTIHKNMSTMMRAIMCFLKDPNVFRKEVGNFSDYFGSHKCPGLQQSVFHSYESVREQFPSFFPEHGTMITLVRDPVERFVSGFMDKCYLENQCNECGKSLSCFLIELYEKTMRSSRNPIGYLENTYMTRHFFPQNWQCEFTNYFGNYSIIKYSSGKGKARFYNELKRVLSLVRVPEEKVEFVLDRLKNEKTKHATSQGFLETLKKNIYKELYSSPYLMEFLMDSFISGYNELNGKDCSDEDYKHAKVVYKELECQNLGDYTNAYMINDVLMLAKLRMTLKDFFKLMNNVVFGKTMENIRNRVDIQLISDETKALRLIRQLHFKYRTVINDNLLNIEMKKRKLEFNKPIYVGFSILDLSKYLMYEFHYDVMKKRYDDKIRLRYQDTDNLIYEIETVDVHEDMDDMKDHYDFSDYPKDHLLYDDSNKKVIGKFKDEINGNIMTEIVALKPKQYAYKTEDGYEHKKSKGVKKNVTKTVKVDDYKRCLFDHSVIRREQNMIRAKKHVIYTIKMNKIALNDDDNSWRDFKRHFREQY